MPLFYELAHLISKLMSYIIEFSWMRPFTFLPVACIDSSVTMKADQ